MNEVDFINEWCPEELTSNPHNLILQKFDLEEHFTQKQARGHLPT
jgi:hypothetical protein